MNIFIREIKANRKSLIIWCISMIVGVLSGMSKYTAYSAGGDSSNLIKELPKSMRALLGIGDLDVTKMSGFFGFLFLYIVVAIAIHAALLGSGIIAKEESDKTTEFLIVKPISRNSVITSKLLAALVNIVILNIVTFVSSIALVAQFNKGKSINSEIITFFIIMFIIQLIFLTLGAMIAATLKKPKAAGSVVTSFVLGAFVIVEITSINENLNFLNVLSPFNYFSTTRIIAGNGISPIIVILTILLIAVLTFLTYFFYNKRDLNI